MGQGFLRGFFIVIAFLLTLVVSGWASAQAVRDHVQITAPPDWVEVQNSPEGAFEAAARLKIAYRLSSFQQRVSKTESERYVRFVMDLLTTGAVEDKGTISMSFDPEFQSLSLHHINVIRNGKISRRLDLDKFEIFRSETDRDKFVFNGRLTISLNLIDLQAGDTLDYAFTRVGKNPALGEGFFETQTQEYSVPEERIFSTLLVEDGLPVYTMVHNDGVEPTVEQLSDRLTRVSYIRDNVPAYTMDDDAPNWSYGYPLHEVSSYDDWSDVGEVFAPYYVRSQSESVKSIAKKIRSENDTTASQARAALDYVQRNIRYLAIAMGQGGYKPRSPDLVLERRFGDCKDVTLLLLSILEELGVSADPMLVDTDELAGVFKALPNYVAFDHVVVLAQIEEEAYVMDATRSPQLGDLQHFAQGSYGKGLVLRKGESKVVSLTDRLPSWTKDFTDRFDLNSDPDVVTFTNTLRYFGEEADSTLDWVNEDGLAAVEKALVDYYRDTYPTIEIAKETELVKDYDDAGVTLKTVFRIPEAWTDEPKEKRQIIWTSPYEIRADFPDFSGADRSTAFALEYPIRTRQSVEIVVDRSYDFDNDRFEADNDAFVYTEVNDWDTETAIYTETYSYRTKRDHITVKDFKSDMAIIDKAWGRMGVTIQKPLKKSSLNASANERSPFYMLLVVLIYLGLIGFLIWVGRLVFGGKSEVKRNKVS